MLFGRQNPELTQVLCEIDRAYVQLVAFCNHVDLVVASDDADEARTLGQSILDNVPAPKKEPGTVLVEVWNQGRNGPEVTQTPIFVPRWVEIERNYPGETRERLTELMKHTPEGGPPGRLILLHGPPGTGKTHAIRALMREWKSWCDAELVVDPEQALFDFPYLQKLLMPQGPQRRRRGQRWRLVVAEDADRFLRSHDRNTGNEALDRLLNASDGILGQGTKTIFLLTTNVELWKINPALARPGRCLSAIAFDLFTPREAKEWLGDGVVTPSQRMTIAELYEAKTGRTRQTSTRDASFGQYL